MKCCPDDRYGKMSLPLYATFIYKKIVYELVKNEKLLYHDNTKSISFPVKNWTTSFTLPLKLVQNKHYNFHYVVVIYDKRKALIEVIAHKLEVPIHFSLHGICVYPKLL